MICSHGIECEHIARTQHYHGHGDIVVGSEYWHDENERCDDALNPATLLRRVSAIIDVGRGRDGRRGDDEQAHIDEDELHLQLIRLFCPQWVVDEIDRLSRADFARWCA